VLLLALLAMLLLLVLVLALLLSIAPVLLLATAPLHVPECNRPADAPADLHIAAHLLQEARSFNPPKHGLPSPPQCTLLGGELPHPTAIAVSKKDKTLPHGCR
jgi:hypothetical protein